MRVSALVRVVIVLALAAAACGGGDAALVTTVPPGSTAGTTTVPPSTTTSTLLPPPATTSAPPPTPTPQATTTTRPPGFRVGAPTLFPPEPLPGSDGANGSGCPPEADLPDGVWYGSAVAAGQDAIEFDPACFFFGEAAEAAAAEDGEEIYGPHFVRDRDAVTARLAVGGSVPVYTIDNSGQTLAFRVVDFADWPGDAGGYTPCPGPGCSVWLYVNDGTVTEILEQYLP